MGELKKITCKACKTQWECRTGCGLSHGKLKWVAELYPDNVKSEIQNQIKENEFIPFQFDYRLSYCQGCHSIVSVPFLRLEADGREYVGSCGQCGKRTELLDKIEKAECPICHETALWAEDIGQWD